MLTLPEGVRWTGSQSLGSTLSHLPASSQAYLTGHAFFPSLISAPFEQGLQIAFDFSIACCLIAAVASLLRGKHYVYDMHAEVAAEAAGAGERLAIAEEIKELTERRLASPELATRYRKER